MTIQGRQFSVYADDAAKTYLDGLLEHRNSPTDYRQDMIALGDHLGDVLAQQISHASKCLIVTTAEDADFLAKGIFDTLRKNHTTTAAVFWNNHYQINSGSVAPVVHKFLQPGFNESDTLVIVKSVISGSCVVRTNLLALLEQVKVSTIYIVAPVVYKEAESTLRNDFPPEISSKFRFIYLAEDDKRDTSGEVIPGIGGHVYQLLGLGDQPSRTGYMPTLISALVDNMSVAN